MKKLHFGIYRYPSPFCVNSWLKSPLILVKLILEVSVLLTYIANTLFHMTTDYFLEVISNFVFSNLCQLIDLIHKTFQFQKIKWWISKCCYIHFPVIIHMSLFSSFKFLIPQILSDIITRTHICMYMYTHHLLFVMGFFFFCHFELVWFKSDCHMWYICRRKKWSYTRQLSRWNRMAVLMGFFR